MMINQGRTDVIGTLSLTIPLFVGWTIGAVADQAGPDDATLGKKPPEGAIVLFNGKDLDGWFKVDGKSPAGWTVADGVMTVEKGSGSIRTGKAFGDFRLHLEFNVPYMPQAK